MNAALEAANKQLMNKKFREYEGIYRTEGQSVEDVRKDFLKSVDKDHAVHHANLVGGKWLAALPEEWGGTATTTTTTTQTSKEKTPKIHFVPGQGYLRNGEVVYKDNNALTMSLIQKHQSLVAEHAGNRKKANKAFNAYIANMFGKDVLPSIYELLGRGK
jgi:hypothetical protein